MIPHGPRKLKLLSSLVRNWMSFRVLTDPAVPGVVDAVRHRDVPHVDAGDALLVVRDVVFPKRYALIIAGLLQLTGRLRRDEDAGRAGIEQEGAEWSGPRLASPVLGIDHLDRHLGLVDGDVVGTAEEKL